MKTVLVASLLAASTVAVPSLAEEFTIERMVANPSINGPTVRGLKVSPDGKRITFLRGKEKKRTQLDLWQFDVATGKSTMLIDSNDLLAGAEEVLSEEEKARRERLRIGGQTGIVSYFWSKDSKNLLFPIGGDIYVMPLGGKAKQLTDTPQFETDIKFSPKSSFVSFIRDRELYVVNVSSGAETKLTSGSTETIANGMAEFVAQEELSRFTGYWWSPDETKIVFEQFDESAVTVKDRYEVQSDGSTTTQKQRYPEAGSTNVSWKLGLVSVSDPSDVVWPSIPGDNRDDYLARVNWSSDSQYFVFQQLSRDQLTNDYVIRDRSGAPISTGRGDAGFQDTSDVWINLTKDFKTLKDGRIMLTREGADGFRHIYFMDATGKMTGQLTAGDWVVSGIKRVDEKAGMVYFSGFKDSPVEHHLYSIPLAGGAVTRITRETGWHNVTVGDGMFVDNFSSPTQPPQVMVRSLQDGSMQAAILENKLDASHPYGAFNDGTVETTFGTIKAEDGTDLHYRMYAPANRVAGKRYPAIMAPYGGPHGQSVRKSWSVNFNDILARNGFVVMVLDNRGMWNRGLKFEGHIKDAMGTVEVTDQVSGTEYLKTLDYIDGDNIGMWGWSYGGYMVLMNMFKEGDVFKAGMS
ncbi:MAG: DPP IV N-terminal domain-containing protein, partial [Kordiimonadaceae bacterium]|nr:DPP IV N-terminal domain-containing protein [Kordiimonadaceae bacterium]